ncbi:hypothetical protein JCM3770_000355 [Rhodotorula araucariae]
MHASLAFAALAACASTAHAFAGTSPVLAFGDNRLPLASLLDPSSPSSWSASAAATAGQQTFASPEHDDLCALSSLVVIAVPGLAYSDLALLPSTPANSAIRAALAPNARGSSLTLPYVPERQVGAHAPASRLARQFAKCQGGRERIAVKLIRGLDETDSIAPKDRDARMAVMHKLDTLVRSLGSSDTRAPRAVVISAALPTLPKTSMQSGGCKHARTALAKRQEAGGALDSSVGEDAYSYGEPVDDEDAGVDASVEDAQVLDRPVVDDDAASSYASTQEGGVLELTEAEYAAAVDPYLVGEDGWDGSILDVTASLQDDEDKDRGNGTSIFQPKDGAGLFHRYVFFTPALILSLLITVIILVPTVIVGASALLAIETPAGLEGKMTGSVGLDPSKAQ